MSHHLMILAAGASLGAKIMAGVLWTGFGVLTITLLVLMRTRWGAARPLSKCFALSLYAHVLLMTYAYCTYLVVPAPPGDGDGGLLNVQLVGGDDELSQAPESTSLSDAPSPAPFDTMPVEKTAPLNLSEPAKPETKSDAPSETPLPDLIPAPPSNLRPMLDTQPAAVVAAPIDLPSASPREMLESIANLPPGPQRISIAPTAAPIEEAAPVLPAPDAGAQLQRLTELFTANSMAEALRPDSDVRVLQGANSVAIVHRQLSDRAPKRAADGEPVPELYRMRVAPDRKRLGRRLGATKESDASVDAALAWLASSQSDDGRWSAKRFGAGQERKVLGQDRQGAGADADTGITGLALLSILGSGHTHLEGPHRATVQKGLEFLCRTQKADGSLAGDAKLFAMMYCHGMASLALGEAYAMTGDHRLEPFVKKAAAFSTKSQHSTTGGWRYLPGDPGDMSQFGWQVMSLKSADLAGIAVPDKTRQGMLRFLHNNTSGKHHGLAGYRAGERPSRTMTAEAYACRVMLEGAAPAPLTDEAAAFILEELPGASKPDFYYWYYGSLAMFQLQDARWQTWNAALQKELTSRQVAGGDDAGSYPTDEMWSGYGGRVYTTSMAALCLEVYYRYLPVYAASEEQRPERGASAP